MIIRHEILRVGYATHKPMTASFTVIHGIGPIVVLFSDN